MTRQAYFDLGRHTRRVSTGSAEAQRWFDLGLNWCFGFNHEEGVRCFEAALAADPRCVMAHWGVAYGAGPFYNLAFREYGEREAASAIALAYDHIDRARALSVRATGVENRLVEALASRFQKPYPVPPRNTTAGTTNTRPKCGGYITTIPRTTTSWRCSPKL